MTHIVGCECPFCRQLRKRVMTTEEWRTKHEPHLVSLTGCEPKQFQREGFDHPAGGWYWLVCPCGARLLARE